MPQNSFMMATRALSSSPSVSLYISWRVSQYSENRSSLSLISMTSCITSFILSAAILSLVIFASSREETAPNVSCRWLVHMIIWADPGLPLRAVRPKAWSSTLVFWERKERITCNPPLLFTSGETFMFVPRPARFVATMTSPGSSSLFILFKPSLSLRQYSLMSLGPMVFRSSEISLAMLIVSQITRAALPPL